MENSKKGKNSDIDPFDLDLTSDTNGFGLTSPVQKEKAPSPQKRIETKRKGSFLQIFPRKSIKEGDKIRFKYPKSGTNR